LPLLSALVSFSAPTDQSGALPAFATKRTFPWQI
jgi:hypothetical protein